jgi:hypothetical protein
MTTVVLRMSWLAPLDLDPMINQFTRCEMVYGICGPHLTSPCGFHGFCSAAHGIEFASQGRP